MQERVVDERQAEGAGPSWYLSRDGQQHGPLTDRELSLIAESGKFKPGDLLWTEGQDGWKAADAVFGLASSRAAAPDEKQTAASEATFAAETTGEAGSGEIEFRDGLAGPAEIESEPISLAGPAEAVSLAPGPEAEASEAVDPDGEHVGALVQALKGEVEAPELSAKERAIEELWKFSGTCGYLWVVFVLLTLHAWVGEARYGGTLGFFVLTTINAFWLWKFLPLADGLGFVQDLKQKPLVYSIVYKAVVFSTLLFAAYAIELMLFGWIGGGGLEAGFTALAGGIVGTMALWLIFCIALLPYFAFKELERAVGPEMIRKLLLGAR